MPNILPILSYMELGQDWEWVGIHVKEYSKMCTLLSKTCNLAGDKIYKETMTIQQRLFSSAELYDAV